MEKVFEKIEKYDILTNIIPGYLMLILNIYYFELTNINIAEQLVISYVIGMTLSRIGALFIGKILLHMTKEKGKSYVKYVCASKEDEMIGKLLLERNTYRTYCTLFVVCVLELIVIEIIKITKLSNDVVIIILLIIVAIIYGASYCRCNKFISDRVEMSKKIKNR